MSDVNADCEFALAVLQSRLDGDFAPDTPQLRDHLTRCQDCQGRFAAAELFLDAYPPAPRVGLTDQIFVAVQRDAQKQRVVRLATFTALAACLLLALRLGWPTAPAPDQAPLVAVATTSDGPFARAKSAVVGWRDSATQNLTLPNEWVPTLSAPDDIATALEPAAASLSHVGTGVANGFEPIADSAKRAVSLFRRDSPSAD